jgi:HPt (histidine-containing phosphotransfer) domain-containing protein
MTDLIDPTVFQDLSDATGEDFAIELLQTFLDDAKTMFADLADAVSRGDTEAYRRLAHSIKSNAQTFGAVKLAEEARAMELAGTIDASAAEALQATYESSATVLKGLLDA